MGKFRLLLGAIIVIVITNLGYSQLLPIGYDTLANNSHEIILNAGLDYTATSVQNDLLSKFIKGGTVTEEIKDNSFDKHGAVNRIGALAGGMLEYRNYNKHLFKKKDWGYLIRAEYNVFAGGLYSKDLYGLAFYGNDRYIGETIDFSGTNMSYMTFQKIGFGMIAAKSKSSVAFNVYNVSDRFTGSFRKGMIVQDANGDSLNLTMDGELQMRNNQKFNQGIGFGVDLDFKVPISWGKRKAYIRFQAYNVGFAYMYEKQKVYTFDTTFNYGGFKFDQLIGEGSLFSDSLDYLDTLGIHTSERNVTVMLPGYLQIGKIVDETYSGQLQSFFGIRLYPSLIYSPYVFAGLDYHPADWVRIGVNASYGGFGKFRAGLYSKFIFGNYSIGLATENVVGLVSKKGMGQSMFINLKCAF